MNKTTKHLSELCKLWQADDKTESEFSEILSFLAEGRQEPCGMRREQAKGSVATLRADTVEKSLDKSEVLVLAPRIEKGCVAIPKAIEEA